MLTTQTLNAAYSTEEEEITGHIIARYALSLEEARAILINFEPSTDDENTAFEQGYLAGIDSLRKLI